MSLGSDRKGSVATGKSGDDTGARPRWPDIYTFILAGRGGACLSSQLLRRLRQEDRSLEPRGSELQCIVPIGCLH